jgi:hypothetical protein
MAARVVHRGRVLPAGRVVAIASAAVAIASAAQPGEAGRHHRQKPGEADRHRRIRPGGAMRDSRVAGSPVPRWLRIVLASDRAGSAWYIGTGFFFAPILAVLSPWPAVTAVLWGVIALAGLWLGLLGIAMAVGLARILRSGNEIPEDYWRGLVKY